MTRSARNRTIIRTGVVGFVAGVATLGVAAAAAPVHSAVVDAVGAQREGWRVLTGQDGRAGGSASDRQRLPAAEQAQDPWAAPQEPSYVQPSPSQPPVSRAS